MFKHASHMWMCGLMIVGAVILVATTGNPAGFIPAVACVAMMWMMMSMMGGNGGSDKGSS